MLLSTKFTLWLGISPDLFAEDVAFLAAFIHVVWHMRPRLKGTEVPATYKTVLQVPFKGISTVSNVAAGSNCLSAAQTCVPLHQPHANHFVEQLRALLNTPPVAPALPARRPPAAPSLTTDCAAPFPSSSVHILNPGCATGSMLPCVCAPHLNYLHSR